MRALTIFLMTTIMIVWLPGPVAAASPFTIKSYDIKLGVDVASGELLVSAHLIVNKAPNAMEGYVSLTERAQVRNCSVVDPSLRFPVEVRSTSGDSLLLGLPTNVRDRQVLDLEFEYTIPIGRMTGNVMVLDRGNRWYPSLLDQVAPFKLTVQMPEGFQAFVSGELQSMDDLQGYREYVWSSKTPVMKISVVLARPDFFRETVFDCEGFKLRFYADTTFGGDGNAILKDVCDLVKFYQELIGPYPHGDLRLVQITGMGNANVCSGLIMLGDGALVQYQNGDKNTLALAVASQWFGSGVFGQYGDRGFWFVTLSIPSYLQMMYTGAASGNSAFEKAMQDAVDSYQSSASGSADISLLGVRALNNPAVASIVLGKGPYVLDILASKLGKPGFEKLLKDLFARFRGGMMSYDSLLASISGLENGVEVARLFEQMMSSTGLPQK